MPAKHFDPTPALIPRDDDADLSDGDSVDLVGQLNDMPLPQRRRVYALKRLYEQTKAIRRRMHAELAELEKKKKEASEALQAKRLTVVLGDRNVTAEEVAALPPLPLADGKKEEEPKKKGVQTVDPQEEAEQKALKAAAASPSGGIPNFWLTCFSHHDALSGMVTEKDRPVLSHLRNITTSFINNNPMEGVRIHFEFDEKNPFLETAQGPLTIGFRMELDEDNDEMVVSSVEGCDIPWKSDDANPTIILKKRKQRNKKTKEMRVVERKEPCESFFNIFKPVKDEEGDDEEKEEDEMDPFDAIDINIEAGQAIIDEIVPKAAFYYSGLSVDRIATELLASLGMDGLDFNDEEDEEEDDDEDEPQSGPRPNFKGMVKKNAPAGGQDGKAPADCKQQ